MKNIKLLLLELLCLLGFSTIAKATNTDIVVVEASNAESLLTAIQKANISNATRTYIYLPTGKYDLGKRVLNLLSGKNICLIGQGMDKTIIVNKPDVEQEGISRTATLLITGDNTYLQDLTIQNAMDYYSSKGAGRAVCIQDMGSHTICNRVRLLSYQDTYYTKNGGGEYYWKNSEIHGTVDFICGRGDVYFDNCRLVIEKRNTDGTGSCVIAAPNTSKTFGMIFYDCTIENLTESYSLARSWGYPAMCHYVNTTLLDPSRLQKSRFTPQGMNVVPDKFMECNTKDTQGNTISPKHNVITFYKGDIKRKMETVETAKNADKYKVDVLLNDWRPDTKLQELEQEASLLMPIDKIAEASKKKVSKKSKLQTPENYEFDFDLPRYVEDLKKELTYPMAWGNSPVKNFGKWEKNARQKVFECMMTPPKKAKSWDMEVLAEEQRDGYKAQKIAFNINAYSRITAYLLIPDGKQKFPAVNVLHDHGAHLFIGKEKMIRPFLSISEKNTPEKQTLIQTILDDADEWAERLYEGQYVGDYLAKHGYVVFSADAPMWGERGRKEGVDRSKYDIIAGNMMMLGRDLSAFMTYDDIAGTDFLASLPMIDSSRIGCMGCSMGGYRSWMLSALSDRIKAGASICWMGTTDVQMSTADRKREYGGFANCIPALRQYLDYPHIASLACPKPMLFINGTQDHLFPIRGVNKAFNEMHKVWDSQKADSQLDTELCDIPHSCGIKVQDLLFFDKYLKK